jgi:hypothetical protein
MMTHIDRPDAGIPGFTPGRTAGQMSRVFVGVNDNADDTFDGHTTQSIHLCTNGQLYGGVACVVTI